MNYFDEEDNRGYVAVSIGIPEGFVIVEATVSTPDRKMLCARKTHIHLQVQKRHCQIWNVCIRMEVFIRLKN